MFLDFIGQVTSNQQLYVDVIYFLLFGVLAFLGDRIARGFLNFPETLLDDRITARRNESYRYAIKLMLGIVPLLMVFVVFFTVFTGLSIFDSTDPFMILIGMWILICTLPLSVFLWREPEL